jgi:ribosomal protein S18 acetylase RimI-like enzyme
MSAGITTRLAGEHDAEIIADISRQTFYDSFAAQNTKENMDKFMREQFSKEALIKEVGAEGNIFLVALAEDEIVGYVRMRESENPAELGEADAIEIARIYTTQQSKGVGQALIQECFKIAGEKRKKIVWLGVWEHNHRAISFYTRWGFEKFGEHVFMLGDDVQTDWLMKKDMNDEL